MQYKNREGTLYLNGQPVGLIKSDGSSGGWGFGRFEPTDAFSSFAALFGGWSLLIHEDNKRGESSRELLDELRDLEKAIDRLRAEIVWADARERVKLRQLTIDGGLIEWMQEPLPRRE